MTWNEISDGQPGLALPAMQNWRHAGRFNVDMIPLDNSGNTLTTGTLKLGTTAAPWAELNIATGGAIYIGGTEFQGGGGGSAVEVFEQKSHLEKVGYDYPLSNPQSQNESFMDSSAMILTLGKTHLNTETTIYLDRDAISISAIDAASATAWTPINTGTTATNTTAGQSVDGTSIKHSVTMTNTSYFMAHSFTAFSLTDRDAKVWLYPNTVANVTSALIRLECATTTVYCEFQIPVASLTAATLNSLYLNMDAPDTTTASFNRSAITRVYLGAKGTATPQAIEWSWDKLRSVDNRKLKVPVQMVCDNGTNQEFINITTATVAGDIYTLETISTYTHTISSSEVRLKQLDVSGGQGVIASGTTGDAALTGWDIQRTYLNTSTSGDLVISSRWYDENYPVATITNASTTVLSVTTSTVAAGIKSGDVVRLYKWEYVDQNYQSPVNSVIGSNFIDLTMTADATATSSQMTLVHGNTSNQNLGGDTADKWRGVRVSADDYYRVETATESQTLLKATPTIFLPTVSQFIKFEDNFNRADGAPANNWTVVTDYSNGGTGGSIYSNQLAQVCDGGYTQLHRIIRNNENYSLKTGGVEITGVFNFNVSQNTKKFGIQLASENYSVFNAVDAGLFTTSATYHGITIKFEFRKNGANINTISIYNGATLSNSVAYTYAAATDYNYRIIASLSGVRVKVWTGTTEPVAWTLEKIGVFQSVGNYMAFLFASSSGSAGTYVVSTDNFIIKSSASYIQKSTISSVSGNKLITATRLTRQDATNQNPIIYQRNAVIV